MEDINAKLDRIEKALNDMIISVAKITKFVESKPLNAGKPWSQEYQDQLKELVIAKTAVPEMAAALGRSALSVDMQIAKMIQAELEHDERPIVQENWKLSNIQIEYYKCMKLHKLKR